MSSYATHLLWIDLETPSLPNGNDYSRVPILEVGAILTDISLNKIDGYTEVVGMTKHTADILQSNPFVVDMHKKSGLIKDSIDSSFTCEQIEGDLLSMLSDHNLKKGSVALAGSGVASFDYPVIKEHMPRLADMLEYYVYDVGIFRRLFKAVSPRDVINPSDHKYGNKKVHRAMADIEDHLGEAKDYQKALGILIAPY